MLKYFYKTLLISILCGSLLMLDMSYKAGTINLNVNSARAESVSTGGIDDSNLMSTLTMVGISVIASRLILYGTITTDIMLAAAGGLAFIAGDMAATSKLKEAKKKIETEIQRGKNGDITDEQRQSLMRLLNMYKASKEAAETKKSLQMAAAAAFAAAAIAAYMASMKEASLTAVCATTTAAVTAAADAALAGVYTSAAAAACLTSEATATAPKTTYLTGREVPKPSCASITTALPSWMGGTTTNKTAAGTCTTFGGLAQGTNCELMYTDLKFNEPATCVPPVLLLATTAATVVLMGINASTIITAIVGFSAPLAEMVDMAIFTPKRRAIVWGVLAGLSFAASSATSNVISQLDADIKKIEALLNSINIQANGTIASNGIQNKSSTITTLKPNEMKVNESETTTTDVALVGGKLPCITKPDLKEGEACPLVSTALQNSVGFNNLPEGFKTDVMSIGKTADGLNGSGTVSASTLSSANSNGANAVRILGQMKKYKTDFQNKLTANKSNTNLDNEEKNLKDAMNKAVKEAIVKNKLNSKNLMASIGTGSSLNELSKATEDTSKLLGDKMKGIGNFKIPTFATPEIPAMPNYTTGTDANSTSELAKMDNEKDANKSGVTMDDYEIKTDITRDSKENIFEVISKRYKKSGYPRLFKRLAE